MSKFTLCILVSLALATVLTIVESMLDIKGPGIFTGNYAMCIAILALRLECDRKR